MDGKIELFVPGRLCLFGEHTDWAGWHRVLNADLPEGRAIVTGIEQGADLRRDFPVGEAVSAELPDAMELFGGDLLTHGYRLSGSGQAFRSIAAQSSWSRPAFARYPFA